MTDPSDLVRQAAELRERAGRESDENLRARLNRMADHYAHLAESQSQSKAHPTSVESLGELFTKPEADR